MASLTEISINARRVIRYGVYAIILILIGRFTFNLTVAIYKKLNPPPPEPPTVLFGKLIMLPFPKKDIPEGLSYKLETPDNNLPEFPISLPVYKMIPRIPEIKALDQARDIAAALGFERNGKPIVENVKNVYVFNKKDSPAQLTMNIVTGVFSVSYDLKADPSAIQSFPPSVEEATRDALSFFKKVDTNNKDLDNAVTTTEFLRLENGQFISGYSQSDSQFIKVNVFRNNIGEEEQYPNVTPKMPEANIWVLYGGNKENRLIAAEYRHFNINFEQSSTYPLITSEEAWNQLKAGNAYIANMKEGSKQITIRKVYLAYYDPEQFVNHYQPVVVFEGDDNFIAYVPAVSPDYFASESDE